MKYRKPEISLLADATQAIQGMKIDILQDSSDPSAWNSTGAYEADE
jgi:hypothetical protein